MLPAICVLLFILLEMDKTMGENEAKEIIGVYFGILLIFILISLLRTLFILNYKLSIKDDKVFLNSLFGSSSFNVKEIKKVELLSYHIYVETYNTNRFYLIPLGFNNIHIVYRLLHDNYDFNNIFNNFKDNSDGIIYRNREEYLINHSDNINSDLNNN